MHSAYVACLQVSYTVWGEGLRLATIRLATAEA